MKALQLAIFKEMIIDYEILEEKYKARNRKKRSAVVKSSSKTR